ncbi:MAG: linear amide C-N hydrolase [Clostridia bacterium]|nr:linear amide C-N hydrolase [Clostridia bacterium]
MKKIVSMLLVICMSVLAITACGDSNGKDPVGNEYEKITKAADMLYEVTYDEYSSEIPPASASDRMMGDMACSGVRNGDFVGRNFDYIMNQCPTFVIRTTANNGRYATIGIGRLTNHNPDTVEAGLTQDELDLLPWSIFDGMNEKGLVVFSNVLFKADCGDIPHTGTNPDAPELNDFFIARAVLDNCATADEAVAYIRDHNITPLRSEIMDLHYMFSDPQKSYVVEFINNEIVVQEQNFMTNYLVNTEEMPEHPDGMERLQVLRDNYDEGSTMDGMYHLMQRVKFTNFYFASNKWYSDLGLTYEQLQNVGDEADAYLQIQQAEYEDELKYIEENGLRETTEWWITVHTAVYDIKNGKLWVTVRERYDEGPHEFFIK